jgi:hypothetical protein
VDRHPFDADLDFTFHFDADQDPDPTPSFAHVGKSAEKMFDLNSQQSKFTFFFSFFFVSGIGNVADPHHHPDADPDPAFHFDADPDLTFHSEADPDPNSPFFPDLDPPMLQNDPLRLPPFHFDEDPDPDFYFDENPDFAFPLIRILLFTLMRMRIRI